MYIIMDYETAAELSGMYNGSCFEPILLANGMYACTVDNLHNPAFVSIWAELATLEIVDSVEFPEVTDEETI